MSVRACACFSQPDVMWPDLFKYDEKYMDACRTPTYDCSDCTRLCMCTSMCREETLAQITTGGRGANNFVIISIYRILLIIMPLIYIALF